jgi:hypothetical protein
MSSLSSSLSVPNNRKVHSNSLPEIYKINLFPVKNSNKESKENLKHDKHRYQNWTFPKPIPPEFKGEIKSLKIIECIINRDHVTYKIEIQQKKEPSWVVIRRYREFHQLYKNIKSVYQGNLPKFPEKVFFSNMSQRNIQERYILLNQFLIFLSKSEKLLNLNCVKFFIVDF